MLTETKSNQVEQPHGREAGRKGRSRRRKPTGLYAATRPAIEFVLAALLLALTAPLMLLAALLVKLTSPGPVLYAQTRLGRKGRPYRIYKIRSMYHNCESVSGPRWSCPGDPRVTPVGRFLRRTHLDELPQLWNVLCGQMSLVGPRPERPELVGPLESAVPHYRDRLLVRPGLTGLAQLQLPPDTDLNSVRRKLAYDLYYVENAGPWMDLRILISTGLYVLGVPCAVIRWLLWLPALTTVEGSYQARTEEEALVPHLQSA